MNRKAAINIVALLVVLLLFSALILTALSMTAKYQDAPAGIVGKIFQKIVPAECEKYDTIEDTQELRELVYRTGVGECSSHLIRYMQTIYMLPSKATEDEATIECGTKTEKDVCGIGKEALVGEKTYSTKYQALLYRDTAFCTADAGCGHGKESLHNPWIYLCAPSSIPDFGLYFAKTPGNNPGPPLDESATKKYEFLNSMSIKKTATYPGNFKLRAGSSGSDIVLCLSECGDDESCKKAAEGG